MEKILYRAILQDADLAVLLTTNTVQICNTLVVPEAVEPNDKEEMFNLFFHD
jgi:hypothetical protein